VQRSRDLLRRGSLIHHRRAGGQSQHSPLPALDAKSDRISKYNRNLREDLTVERLVSVEGNLAAPSAPRRASRRQKPSNDFVLKQRAP
jgi:hypothetical protein